MNYEQLRREQAAKALLAFYSQEIARYRQHWGMPPDREAHLTAWAKARERLAGGKQPTKEIVCELK